MRERSSGIYLIRNIINNHLYVGQSIHIYKRWTDHKSLLNMNKHPSIHLQRAWNTYGPDKFEFTILYKCSSEPSIICEAEQYFMDLLTPEYNTLPTSGSSLGYKHTETTKVKISNSNKGIPKSESMRQALKNTWATRKEELLAYRGPVSEETKRKMSESQQKADHPCRKPGPDNPNTGKKRSPEVCKMIGDIHRGKVLSEETKEKIAAKLRGVPLSEERKQAMRKAPRPKQSPEQIAKRVAATKATKLKKKEK
jgi:group I intron endonuclease